MFKPGTVITPLLISVLSTTVYSGEAHSDSPALIAADAPHDLAGLLPLAQIDTATRRDGTGYYIAANNAAPYPEPARKNPESIGSENKPDAPGSPGSCAREAAYKTVIDEDPDTVGTDNVRIYVVLGEELLEIFREDFTGIDDQPETVRDETTPDLALSF